MIVLLWVFVTSAGLGVGTSAAKLDRVLPGNHCKVKNGSCGVGTLCGVRRSTDFQIRNGRVSEVSISIESSYDDGSLQAPNPVCRRS